MASFRVPAAHTVRPSTKRASVALALATNRARTPWLRAARASASTPRTGLRLPSRPSSAALQTPSSCSRGSWPLAPSSPRAIGRSKAGPSLRRSAGARLTTTRVRGTLRPLLRRAPRTRSRDSCTAASARPTISRPGRPGPMSTSTVTGRTSRPRRPALPHRANIRSRVQSGNQWIRGKTHVRLATSGGPGQAGLAGSMDPAGCTGCWFRWVRSWGLVFGFARRLRSSGRCPALGLPLRSGGAMPMPSPRQASPHQASHSHPSRRHRCPVAVSSVSRCPITHRATSHCAITHRATTHRADRSPLPPPVAQHSRSSAHPTSSTPCPTLA